jgi:galactonate dehydratase
MLRHWLKWDVPGLGVEVDEREAAKHPFRQEVKLNQTAIAEDGAVLDF